MEVGAFVTTKKQFEEVFLPASRPTTPGTRSPYVTLFAVRHRRLMDFDSARARSIRTRKNNIFIEYADPDEPIVVGYFAKNAKDLAIYKQNIGKRQKGYFVQSNIVVEFHEGREKL